MDRLIKIKMETIDVILICLMIVFVFVAGLFTREVYQSIMNKRVLNGLYIGGYDIDTQYEAMEVAYKGDKLGDWVCVNVAYDMTPKEAYKTCIHECSHKSFDEIYAEECEKNEEKCMEVLEKITG